MDKIKELIRFIDWMSTKSRIQISEKILFPKRRQIWLVHLGQNVGAEINSKNEHFERPVLVINVFNSETLFVAPITSTLDKHAFLIKFDHGGIQQSVNIYQLLTLSIKRFDRKISDISEADFSRIIDAIRKYVIPIQTESPS